MVELAYHSISDGLLYAMKWPEEGDHCLNLLMERWTDQEYLRAFFKERKEDLKYFKNRQIVDAVIQTFREARWIKGDILSICDIGITEDGNTLDQLFAPLDNRIGNRSFIQAKAKGDRHAAPWIRIYAIKIDENEYVITGGGIKLTKTMEEDPLLQIELIRLQQAEDYFKSQGWI